MWEANPLCIFSMKNRFLNISMQVLNIYIYIIFCSCLSISEFKIKGHSVPWSWQWKFGTYIHSCSFSIRVRIEWGSSSADWAWSSSAKLYGWTNKGSIWCCKKQYWASYNGFILFTPARCFAGIFILFSWLSLRPPPPPFFLLTLDFIMLNDFKFLQVIVLTSVPYQPCLLSLITWFTNGLLH